MQATSLKQVADWAGGRLIQGRAVDSVSIVSTDTRTLAGGELFVALKGERFNGHKFLDNAAEAGVAAILVSELPLASESFPGGIIHVGDTLKALQNLAAGYRRSRQNLFAIGLTGSNGKTSTKDFLGAVLSKAGPVNATLGNLNNHIGLPLTILRTETEHRHGVWEMGMNHPGEIEVLAEIAEPNAAVITNVGTAHIEHMKTRDAIGLEKGMLAEAIDEEGFVVLNANDEYTDSIRSRCVARVITAGIDTGDVVASVLEAVENGTRFQLSADGEEVEVLLPVPGEHMVSNAVLAAAVGLECGLTLAEIADGLAGAKLSGSRLERVTHEGIEFLDDSYNANPDSMRAALRTLMSVPASGQRIAVLGRMAELGEHEEKEHRALGEEAAEAGVDGLIAVGETAEWVVEGTESRLDFSVAVKDQEAAAEALHERASAGDVVLIKGSRSSAMEKTFESFQRALSAH